MPMVFWTADGMKGHVSHEEFQTPDVLPTILKQLDIKQTAKTDGHARKVK